MKAFITIFIATILIVLTVLFNNALFKLSDIPFMSNTLMEPDRDPLLEVAQVSFTENRGSIPESNARWQREMSAMLQVNVVQNDFNQDMFSSNNLATALGANESSGAVISKDSAELLLPGFRELSTVTDETGKTFQYLVWHPELSIYTNDWIASPFPQTWASSSRPNGVDIKNADGTVGSTGPIVFTYASPLNMNASDTETDAEVRRELGEVANDLRSGTTTKVATDRVQHLSNILRGSRPVGSPFNSLNVEQQLSNSFSSSFADVFGLTSPILGEGFTIQDEFDYVLQLMSDAGYPEEMIRTVMLTLVLTSVNDYAITKNNADEKIYHWWDNLSSLEYAKGWRRDTANVAQDVSQLTNFVFSPLSMVTLPKATAQPNHTANCSVFKADDLQLYGGAVIQLYNKVRYGSTKPALYVDADTVKNLLFNGTTIKGNFADFKNPYRDIPRNGGNIQVRAKSKIPYDLVESGKKNVSSITDSQVNDICLDISKMLSTESSWSANDSSTVKYALYAYLHNYILAFKTDTDAYSLTYDSSILPSHFSDHRLIGSSIYTDSLNSMLYGQDQLIANARAKMIAKCDITNAQTFPEGVIDFMREIVSKDLSRMAIRSVRGVSRNHYFVYPFMLGGDMMADGITAMLAASGDHMITSTHRVMLAWWNYNPTFVQPAGSAITTSTAEFLPVKSKDEPINVVGMMVDSNAQFGTKFLTSFIQGADIYGAAEPTEEPTGGSYSTVNKPFINYLLSSPGLTEGRQANLLRDIYGGQNLAAFNNGPGGDVKLRVQPSAAFLAYLRGSPYEAIQDKYSMKYDVFLNAVPTGIDPTKIVAPVTD